MGNRLHLSALVVGIISFLLFLNGTGEANSFPFRAVNPGDPLPTVTLTEYKSSQQMTLEQLRNNNAMLVFWGADIPTKKKRSIDTLKVIKKLSPFLKDKKIQLLSIDIQNDGPEVIDEVLAAAEFSMPVYLDPDRKAYGELGIFVMPSIMLVDLQGKVVAGMGYSRDLPKRLKGEIEVMLGEKTRAQVEEELRPQMVEKSKEEKDAKRHMHMGLTMIQRGQPDAAIIEFNKAVEFEPNMSEAHEQLGCLYIDIDKIDLAKESLAKSLKLNPDSLDGQICRARVKAKEGNPGEAIDDLKFLMLRSSRDANLHYILATLLEEQKQIDDAAKEYRSAYELLFKKSMLK
ncbi:MAG: redoxin family protein [Proteobacteria bacterium]|nr:redoxin family protein [Pseudomonadota bacterium]MBU1716897.1 redoxin family protein [Pseudomonadota bacterium]